MSDKEPRRRKKRKDSQSRKDDIRSDDHLFMPSKPEPKDSDADNEEDYPVPSSQPSGFAKFVFVILFSGLVLSMSFVFISLRGSDQDLIVISDGHTESILVPETNVVQEESPESDPEPEPEPWSLTDEIQESIQDFFPKIGSILSFNNEHVEESQTTSEEAIDDVTSDAIDDQTHDEMTHEESSLEYDATDAETSTNQEDTSQTEEYLVTPEIYIETSTQPFIPEPEDSDLEEEEENPFLEEPVSYSQEPVTEPEEEFQYTSPQPFDDSDYTSPSPVTPEPEQSYYTEPSEPVQEPAPVIEEPEPEMKEETFPYEKADITNEDDFGIRKELDDLEADLIKSPERMLAKAITLLQLHKESPRLLYIKAQALDKLAETLRSNKHLEDAIATYQEVMATKRVPDQLYLLAGKKAADKMRFRGFMGKSVKLLLEMEKKFPENVELKNLIAVGYLLIGQNKEAKKVLLEVLKIAPDSGFAKVHLGFILKIDESNYNEAIKWMSEGIASREAGAIDGRFYFHLGDALNRVGNQKEAMKVYEEAVKEDLFLSAYQRSLYNVDGLTGKPWWNPYTTTYAPYFKLLEKNWLSIRDEALAIIDEKGSGFTPETEGLQDKGDWKQLELFARGRRIEKNCLKVPKTCDLISQMPDAASCKRGQVKFSIMRPSTHVWAHTGPTNCRLRAHLGLVVPEGASIRVADETRVWKEGKVLLFDDSFEHEVWHNGNASRLVLIVDFWHPELTAYQKRSLTPI